MKVFVEPGQVKFRGKTCQKIIIAFVFVMYILRKISFNAICRYVVSFICPLKFCLPLFHSMALMNGNKGAYIKYVGGGPWRFTNFSKVIS